MVKYTEKKVSKTLESLKHLLVLGEQHRQKMKELQIGLTRIQRAINKTFWIDERDWKKKTLKEKNEIIRNEICVKFQSSGSYFQDAKDFPYFAKKQWEKDRAKLIKSGEIEK